MSIASQGGFHIRRSNVAQDDALKQYNGLRTTRWERPPDGKSVLEIQTTQSGTAVQKIPKNLNYLTPPYHWHWYQTEYFNITEG